MMRTLIYRILTGLLMAGWMTVIFMFSAQPAAESGRISGTIAYRVAEASDRVFHLELGTEELEAYARWIDNPIRKCAHMTEYAILGWLCCFFLAGYMGFSRRAGWTALGISALYAATDELHQLWVPGRSGQPGDVCIDAAGAAAGLLALYLFVRIARRRGRKRQREKA